MEPSAKKIERADGGSDRRHWHRRPALDVHGRSPLLDFVILNIGSAGMAIETRQGLRVGVSYPFTLIYQEHVVHLEGSIRWCRLKRTLPIRGDEVQALYRAGIAFVDIRTRLPSGIWSDLVVFPLP